MLLRFIFVKKQDNPCYDKYQNSDRKEIPETSAPTAERRNRRRADPGSAAADRRIQAISVPTAERNARMPFGSVPADRKIKETSARTAENRDSKNVSSLAAF